jgi:hypothetical protein
MKEKSNHLKSILNAIAIALVVQLSIFASQTSSLAVQPGVAAGHDQTVGLKSDGTVVAVGWNENGLLNVGNWTDIVQVACWNHTVGVKSDGTVVAVGANFSGQCNLFDWNLNPKAEIISTWSNGIWYWDESESKWTKMATSTPTGDIAAGDFTGDGKADVASCWSNGLWYQNGATLEWTKVSDTAPMQVTAGDVTGD